MVSHGRCVLLMQRSSRRAAAKGRKRYSDYDYDEDLADDVGAVSGDDDGPSPKRFRNVRFTTEDRRFGESHGTARWLLHSGRSAPLCKAHHQLPCIWPSPCKLKALHTGHLTAGIYDERRYQANGHASPRSHTPPKSARGHLVAMEPDERDSGMVECPCGVTCDDGQAMIECERCKVRTHQDRAHGNCEVMLSNRDVSFARVKHSNLAQNPHDGTLLDALSMCGNAYHH